MECKEPRIAKTILKKKKAKLDYSHHDFKISYKTFINQDPVVWE